MIRIIALTETGRILATKLQQQLTGSTVWYKPKPFGECVQKAFIAGDALLFIGATGIIVRTLAPVIGSKHSDPPVLVLDERERFVIPLLSGHEGGANDWGKDIADKIGAELVLTTANAYINPVYTVGMGCERGCSTTRLAALLNRCLEQSALTLADIDSIHSIDIKSDEQGLIGLAEDYAKPFCTWGVNALSKVEQQLSTRSDYVFQTVGVYGVAESAALVGASAKTTMPAELVLTKQKNAWATCAIARSYASQ